MAAKGTLSRREWLRRISRLVLGAGWGAGAGSALYGVGVEPFRIEVERWTVGLDRLPGAFDGFRIVQLSDLHLHPWTQGDEIARAIEVANSLRPDAVFLTGDFVTHDAEPAEELQTLLRALRAPAGVFACLGNHDFRKRGVERISRAIRGAGHELLRNRSVPLAQRGDRLVVAGLDSRRAGHPRLKEALRGVGRDAVVFLLMHEPDFADAASRESRVIFQASGHTHGGQVRLPGVGALVRPKWGRKYVDGWFRVGQLDLYVNRGLGCTGLPIRWLCPPEITEFTLRAGPAPPFRRPIPV
jgi:predicted MPP superfamily phosphohydrolase